MASIASEAPAPPTKKAPKPRRSNGYGEDCSLELLSLCRDQYLRNNKRGGLKNLRCFPECLPSGHNPSGFCGHQVNVIARSKDPLPESAMIVARFSVEDDDLPSDDSLTLKPNGKIVKQQLVSRTRSRKFPLKEFFGATRVGASVATVAGAERQHETTFVLKPTSWHYGWRSSKHTKNQKHRLYLYLMLPPKKRGGRMFYVAKTETTPFSLASSKRARTGHQPAAQHLAVTEEEIAAGVRLREERASKRLKLSKNRKAREEGAGADRGVEKALLKSILDKPSLFDSAEPWVPLSRQSGALSARHKALQRLLAAVNTIPEDKAMSSEEGVDQARVSSAEGWLQGLIKTELVESSPFANFNPEGGGNGGTVDQREDHELGPVLHDLANFLVENEEMTAAISLFLRQHRNDIEHMSQMDTIYEKLLTVIEGVIDDFLVRKGSSIGHVMQLAATKASIVNDAETIPRADLGLWILSQVAPQDTTPHAEAANSPAKASSVTDDFAGAPPGFREWAMWVNKRYEPPENTSGSPNDIMRSLKVPWLARKIVQFFFRNLQVILSWDKAQLGVITIIHKARLGLSSSMKLKCDGKVRQWPKQDAPMFGMMQSPHFGGTYTAVIEHPGTERAKATIVHCFKNGIDAIRFTATFETDAISSEPIMHFNHVHFIKSTSAEQYSYAEMEIDSIQYEGEEYVAVYELQQVYRCGKQDHAL